MVVKQPYRPVGSAHGAAAPPAYARPDALALRKSVAKTIFGFISAPALLVDD
jgi:hypothetical protein